MTEQINQQAAVESLYQCLLDMGKAGSNPVLAILSEPDNFTQGMKYPSGDLHFAGIGMRAYYHSHAEPYLRQHEHGHFHIFIADGSSDTTPTWGHVVALSVDHMGQAQNWFCVNNWVTGGQWLSTDAIRNLLLNLLQQDTDQLMLVEKWIFYMLAVYQPKLIELLATRDRMLDQLTATGNPESILNDRTVYDMAETPIDLLNDLTKIAKV